MHLLLPLLAAFILVLSACLPPDRTDYSPDDEVDDSGGGGLLPADDDDDDVTAPPPTTTDDDDLSGDDDDDDDDTSSGGNTGGNGDLRLVNGGDSTQGRVEVLYEGVWGTVCDDDWDTNDAEVVCRQLGLPSGVAEAVGVAEFGEGEDPIWLDNVLCDGSEARLDACEHNGWGNENCGHGEDAGVRCN